MSVSLQSLIEQGLIHAPSKLYGEFGGFQFEATVNADGSLTAGGREFNSLSVAAGCLITAKTGRVSSKRSYFACNGWKFWHVRDADGNLYPVDQLRVRLQSV